MLSCGFLAQWCNQGSTAYVVYTTEESRLWSRYYNHFTLYCSEKQAPMLVMLPT